MCCSPCAQLSVHPVPESFIHKIEDFAFRNFKQQETLKERCVLFRLTLGRPLYQSTLYLLPLVISFRLGPPVFSFSSPFFPLPVSRAATNPNIQNMNKVADLYAEVCLPLHTVQCRRVGRESQKRSSRINHHIIYYSTCI